ncbi:L,D-transpeptidase [Candidatus Gottesmanbacteria bacterium]|nr:L,D-transpeptidase [Candidatus Gottesmanbacteria bacterium]
MHKAVNFLNWASFLVISCVILLGLTALSSLPSPQTCANSLSCIKDLSGRIEMQNSGIYMSKTITVPPYLLAYDTLSQQVLGKSTGPKRIEVDLTHQHLYAFEGDNVVMDFPVSSGKWYPTPTGTFRIWVKLRATRMAGGNPAIGTYYNLPNVPWTMFYYNDQISKERGFSLHGAYWHNNFGHPMSHGCVNIAPDNAKRLYDWAEPATSGFSTSATKDEPGTLVTVYGTAPEE